MFVKTKVRQSSLAAIIVGTVFLTAATGACASGSEDGGASTMLSLGTMSILEAPAASMNGNPPVGASAALVGSVFVIAGSVQGGGDSVQIILNGVGNSAKITIDLSKSAVQTLALSTGTVVQLSAEASGTMLIASGKVIAFIPNKLGKALLFQSRLPAN